MKNLTRVLALVLAMSLVLGTVAFAAFTDVKAGDDYAEAIETLAALGIIKGYEDGSFGADKAITRAEAVAIVNRIQGLEKAAAGAASASLYTDVAADHWALGDINLATQMGIISGDGNGKFRPEDQVSYQEMVKMLTCAVNYQPAVEELGGWPTGYLVAAQTYGILEDTTNLGAAAANRGVVAQLTFNTLTAPLMVQEGFGTNKTYKVKDVAGETQTLLSEKLKIYKVDAEVIGTDVAGDIQEVGYAKIKIGKDTEDLYEVKKPSGLDYEQKVLVADSTIDAKLSYQVVAYLQKNADREWQVLYNTVEEGTNVEVTFATAEIEDVKTDVAKPYILVLDENDKEVKYYINKDTKLYVNGEAKDVAITDAVFNYKNANEKFDGNVTLLYLDKNDDIVSKVFVESWLTDVVEEIAPNGTTIYLKNSAPIALDVEDNEALVYSLTLDGKDIAVADLKENDVVTYISANNKNYYKILVSRSTVEGTVDAYYSDDALYTIAGNDYEVSQSALEVAGSLGALKMKEDMSGTTGVFYLDAFGKLAGFSKTSVATGAVNYGYILAVKDNFDDAEEFSYEATAKILTKDGIKDIDFADKVYVTEVKFDADGEVDADKNSYAFADKDKTAQRAAFADHLANVVAKDLIDYTVNSDGKINSFAYWTATAFETKGENDYITKNASENALEFTARNSTIGKYAVTADTVIFYVGASDKEDYAVTDIKFLVDEEDYDVTVYGMDMDRNVGALLVTNEVQSADLRGNLALYVSNATVSDEDGQSVTQVVYYQGGEKKTVVAETKLDMSGFETGDVIAITTNTKGILTDIDTIDVGTSYAYPALSKNAQYVYGQVYGRTGNTLKVGAMPGTENEEKWDNHTVDADAKVYIVELKANGKIAVEVAELGSISRNMYFKEKDANGKDTGAMFLSDIDDAANFSVVLKYVDGDVIDVVAYKNFINPTKVNKPAK